MRALYDDALTLRDARALYFERNGFPADGGYTAKWVKLALGPLRFGFPNTPGRVRAVRFHDLHHVVTDYATNWVGEAEIGAWEVASSCAGHLAAWVLNLYALAIGLWIAPRATWRAFARGRRTRNLYRRSWDEALLARRVGELRRELGLGAAERAAPPLAARDRFAFLGWSAAALALQLATAAAFLGPLAAALRACA
jgi:hypothetical protein